MTGKLSAVQLAAIVARSDSGALRSIYSAADDIGLLLGHVEALGEAPDTAVLTQRAEVAEAALETLHSRIAELEKGA